MHGQVIVVRPIMCTAKTRPLQWKTVASYTIDEGEHNTCMMRVISSPLFLHLYHTDLGDHDMAEGFLQRKRKLNNIKQ